MLPSFGFWYSLGSIMHCSSVLKENYCVWFFSLHIWGFDMSSVPLSWSEGNHENYLKEYITSQAQTKAFLYAFFCFHLCFWLFSRKRIRALLVTCHWGVRSGCFTTSLIQREHGKIWKEMQRPDLLDSMRLKII